MEECELFQLVDYLVKSLKLFAPFIFVAHLLFAFSTLKVLYTSPFIQQFGGSGLPLVGLWVLACRAESCKGSALLQVAAC